MNSPDHLAASLKLGSALMKARVDGHYAMGSITSVIRVTSPLQMRVLAALAQSKDPYKGAPVELHASIAAFLQQLSEHDLLVYGSAQLTQGVAHNAAQERRAPEIQYAQWRSGGAATIAARASAAIEISGRSRVATLVHSILSASGISDIRFYDRRHASAITPTDIGIDGIIATDVGLNFYQRSDSHRARIALLPHAAQSAATPMLTIHCGPVDIEQLLEWLNNRRPHLVIHASIGGSTAIGPLVVPGKSPCLRCLELYEIDNCGYTQMARLSLMKEIDLSVASAHYVAALVAEQALSFIDGLSRLGEVTYLSATDMREPQVVVISRHPLCGCSDY
jgi:hypothetical protein